MLSQKDIAEAREMLANCKPRKVRTLAEVEEEERRLADPYPPLGQLIEAEQNAKALAARRRVEPLSGDPEYGKGHKLPFKILLGTIQYGAWRNTRDLAKAYSKSKGWVARLRAVVISQGWMTKAEWREAFSRATRV